MAGVPYTKAGGYAEAVAVPADLTFPVPDWLEPQKAAALPLNYLTAYTAVEHAARPRAGERVLVHEAATAHADSTPGKTWGRSYWCPGLR